MTARIPPPEAATHLPLAQVSEWLASHAERMIADMASLVSIESPSGDRAALDACAAWIEDWTSRLLGPARSVDRRDHPEFGALLVFDYAGSVPGAPVVLLAHYDTVWELGTLQERPWSATANRAAAPGGFDMKAGLVQAVWAIAATRAVGLPRPPIRLVITPDEEIGSPFSRSHIERTTEDAVAVLVLESAADGALKTARSGVGLFRVEVSGVAAHAGLDPDAGVSAIDELARIVLSLHAATDHAAGTRVNVGQISGGSRPNVIAAHAAAELDVRVNTRAEADRIDAILATLTPQDPRARIEVSGAWNRPVMERTEQVAGLFDLARSVGHRLGEHIEEVAVGGVSDGNFVAWRGIPVLDGLGAVGGGAHATDEWVDLEAAPRRAALVAGIMAAFGANTAESRGSGRGSATSVEASS